MSLKGRETFLKASRGLQGWFVNVSAFNLLAQVIGIIGKHDRHTALELC